MDGTELRRLRERLGLTVEELAAALGEAAADVQAWEDSRKRIPRWQVEPIRWQLTLLERKQLLDRSRLPRCAWFDAWEADGSDAGADVQEAVRHVAGCRTCIRRRRYVEERLGPEPPFPEGAVLRALGPVVDLFLPGPTGNRSLKLAFLLPALLLASALLRYAPSSDWVPWVLAPLALVAGLVTVPTVFHGLPALRDSGPRGRWAVRAFAIAAGVVVFGCTILLSGHTREIFGGRPVSYAAGIGVAVLLGLVFSSVWSFARTHNRV